jgi:hypothetical protein
MLIESKLEAVDLANEEFDCLRGVLCSRWFMNWLTSFARVTFDINWVSIIVLDLQRPGDASAINLLTITAIAGCYNVAGPNPDPKNLQRRARSRKENQLLLRRARLLTLIPQQVVSLRQQHLRKHTKIHPKNGWASSGGRKIAFRHFLLEVLKHFKSF